ncbi:nitroreductase family protein [Allokutzneria albata]|uniref:Nitroreductase family protein n=1 Tax=Allokutzneria albata TaxID=211114 RepID=A0A1G9T5C8_ALLAB|nr:nitroreductase family protein [Allokutzneria albata]SDM42837.1 Nitroreductase family protein [Allokutzneria albata]
MGSWTRDEARTLIDAVGLAPSVHNIQPWSLQLSDHHALLFERRDSALPGRDRLLACGAALANLELAVRFLGRRTETSLLGDPLLPDWIAAVTAGDPEPPSRVERARFAAIPRRRSYRLPFAPNSVSDEEIQLIAEAASSVVGVKRISVPRRPGSRAAGDGIDRETVLVLYTEDDSRREHLLAGVALQRAWLEATALGLAASVVTQPLHVAEVRDGVTAWLDVPGHPHALLRLGMPISLIPGAPRKSAHAFVLEGRS